MISRAAENIYTLIDHQLLTLQPPLSTVFHDIIGFAIPAFICGTAVAALTWFRLALRRYSSPPG